MLVMNKDGVVKKVHVAMDSPPRPQPRRAPMRTRGAWVSLIRGKAQALGSRYFAFRHGKRWLLCDAHQVGGAVVKELPDDSREAAEMWVMYKEQERG